MKAEGSLNFWLQRGRAGHFVLTKTAAYFVAHPFAKFCPARGPVLFAHVKAIEHIEIFQDRMAIAGHGQNAKQLPCRAARARNFPSPYRIRAALRQAAQLRHVGRGERLADRLAKIAAELLQFGPII